jgi:hypothetical protein
VGFAKASQVSGFFGTVKLQVNETGMRPGKKNG